MPTPIPPGPDPVTLHVGAGEGPTQHREGLCGKVGYTGWYPGPDDAPTLCLVPHRCHTPNVLDLLLLLGDPLTVALTAPAPDDPRSAPSRHPHLNLRITPGLGHIHEWCATVDLCGVCTSDLFELLLTAGHGRIARRLTTVEAATVSHTDTPEPPEGLHALFPGLLDPTTVYRPFTLTDRTGTLHALDVVASRSRIVEEELPLDR